jgi:hypothetical protein
MKEITGNNLKKIFDAIDPQCKDADIIYAYGDYEVWKVSDELFEKMCDMLEVEFVYLEGTYLLWEKGVN